MQIIGTITHIAHKRSGDHEKKVVTLEAVDNQKLFVEFRGQVGMDKVAPYSEGDSVAINLRFDGKQSSSGQPYNNLVGLTVEPVKPTYTQPEMAIANGY